MTQRPGGQSPPQHGNGSTSTTEAVKEEVRGVASTAVDRGESVAETAVGEAKHLAEHAQREARDLLREGRDQLESQARDGQRKAAQSLHDLADQLDRMAKQADVPGVATDVAREAAERTHSVARWLEDREPGDLLGEVRGLARRRPGAFLIGAAVAGVLVGRLTRGAVAHDSSARPVAGDRPTDTTPGIGSSDTPAIAATSAADPGSAGPTPPPPASVRPGDARPATPGQVP